MDHPVFVPVAGLEQPGQVIELLRPHVDAFLVNFGVANTFRKELTGKAVLLRTDNLDPDMLEERARTLLGYGYPGDLVVLRPVFTVHD